MGWADPRGFDELRVAASSSQALPGFGHPQAIAIDDVRAQVVGIFSVSPVVEGPDRTATFDSLTSNGTDLSIYTENLLSIAVDDTNNQGFPAFSPGDGRTTGQDDLDSRPVECISNDRSDFFAG